jgi:hypothetical protein
MIVNRLHFNPLEISKPKGYFAQLGGCQKKLINLLKLSILIYDYHIKSLSFVQTNLIVQF